MLVVVGVVWYGFFGVWCCDGCVCLVGVVLSLWGWLVVGCVCVGL